MSKVRGISPMCTASLLDRILLPSKGNRGISAGLEPVAMMILSACNLSLLPSFFSTSTVSGPASLPLPSMSVTPQLLNRVLMPFTWMDTTAFFLSMIFAMFGETEPLRSMPKSERRFALWKASEEAMRDFVGMQPQLRHVPPTSSCSMTAVWAPNWAALIAATYPPGPPPSTAILTSPPLRHTARIPRHP